jgi:protocatechuate 3,4-dioxygenase alpha subunit
LTAPVTPSQTVGPFFGVGLPYHGGEHVVAAGTPGAIRVEGQVLDGHGDPVPDALIEIWQPDAQGCYRGRNGGGFGRRRTDQEGAFHFVTLKPGPTMAPDGRTQAPHLNVTVFARGLLRHLVTRMYFPDEVSANAADPVLNMVDPTRRSTLIARADGHVLRFDIRLQGDSETVFFVI